MAAFLFARRKSMPRLIFTSHYLRDAPPEHLENYVRYIGIREGVEKIDESKRFLPAAGNQKALIAQLIWNSKEMNILVKYDLGTSYIF